MRDHLGNPFFSGRPDFARGILLLDDCEGTFTYQVDATAGDYVAAYAVGAAWTGTKGLQLRTRTTGAAQFDYVTATKEFAPSASGLLVARLRVAMWTKARLLHFTVTLDYASGTRRYTARLRHEPNTPATTAPTTAGAHVTLAGGAVLIPDLAWVDVELVIDLRTQTYLSARFAGIDLPVAGLAMWDQAADTGWYCRVRVTTEAIGANCAEIIADNLYVGEYLEL